MKTSELTGAALDWAVSQAEGIEWEPGDFAAGHYGPGFAPATNWADGGPIIEREWIDITPWPNEPDENLRWQAVQFDSPETTEAFGPTPLIAAMRCYVASKLGDEVEIPSPLKS